MWMQALIISKLYLKGFIPNNTALNASTVVFQRSFHLYLAGNYSYHYLV